MNPDPPRIVPAFVLALLAVAITVGGLLVGYEPTGGDPDRMYRPIKSELARALRAGRLPFWSDQFGLGVPLVAESHVAAFYPLNILFYRGLELGQAYRLAMWLHYIALAAATYSYARALGLLPWGSALAAFSFTFCGFQAIHASHEPFYHALPYLPLALLATERFTAGGSAAWLAALAITWGAQLTLGHFQIQAWTAALVLLTGCWRLVEKRGSWWRGLGLAAALGWGAAIAAVQLALSAEMALHVPSNQRSIDQMWSYGYPPEHLAELVAPGFFRGLVGGHEGAYWVSMGTTAYEACLYVGTVTLILACVGLAASRRDRDRALAPWGRLIVPLSLALATVPYWGERFVGRWWPDGYFLLLKASGLGLFRAPGRYMVLASLGLCLFAGRGLDRAVPERPFRLGLALACALAALGVLWSWYFSHQSAALRTALGPGGLWLRLAAAAVAWAVSLAVVVAWRRGRVGAWWPFLVVALELGVLYYRSTTVWGWAVRLPESSPVLRALAAEGKRVGRVAGRLDNLPVRIGANALYPYLGVRLRPLDNLVRPANARGWSADPLVSLLLRRFGTTHGVWDLPVESPRAEVLYRGPDLTLDELAYRPPGSKAHATWSLVRHPDPFPSARVARFAFSVVDRFELIKQLVGDDSLDHVWYLRADLAHDFPAAHATAAQLLEWDDDHAQVVHDGPCDLVITRAFYPGWTARARDGQELLLYRADGGIQAVHIPGSGTTHIALRFRPSSLAWAVPVSACSAILAALALAGFGARGLARRMRGRQVPGGAAAGG